MDEKQGQIPCYLKRACMFFRYKDMTRLKVKEWRNIYEANGNQMRIGMDILISDKINFK